MKKKIIALVASLALVASVGAGATLAYLTDTTDEVVNTFAVGKVGITLQEVTKLADTTTSTSEEISSPVTGDAISKAYTNLLPGDTVTKRPFVIVEAGSAKAFVFVKVVNNSTSLEDAQGNAVSALTYTVLSGWTKLTGVDNVYYRIVDTNEQNTRLYVFEDATVSTLVNENNKTLGNITVDAAAVQYDHVENVDLAYAQIAESLQ